MGGRCRIDRAVVAAQLPGNGSFHLHLLPDRRDCSAVRAAGLDRFLQPRLPVAARRVQKPDDVGRQPFLRDLLDPYPGLLAGS
ncbi:hypothetical protein D3C73_1401550 [compost metagenome]